MNQTLDISPIEQIYELRKSESPGSKIFLESDQPLTYRQLFDRIERLAAVFDQLKVSRGDRVLIASENDSAVSTIVLALLRCGITAVPVNPHSSTSEFEKLIAKAEIKGAFLDQEICRRLESSGHIGGFPVVPVTEDVKSSLFDRFKKNRDNANEPLAYPALCKAVPPAKSLPSGIPASSVAYILFTSGTTSEPKGVEITHANLFANFATLEQQYGYSAETRLLNILPLHHADGLVQGPMLMFAIGASCYRPMNFQLEKLGTLMDSIYRLRITHWLTVPTILALATEFGADYADAFRTPDFQFVISTAGFLDANIWQRFEEQFQTRIINVYGLTETVCEALYCGPSEETRRIGTIGKPVDVETRIIDDRGRDVPTGEIGELILKGDNIMRGYFNMPEATAEVIRDGWLYSGDLASCDEDGFYKIVGRKKNVIISGGLNVYPEDVASVLRNIPGVIDAVVFGIEDDRWGERVAACVEIDPARKLTTETIRSSFLEQASVDLVPHEIAICNKLPRGPAGKVIIDEARKLLDSSQAQAYGEDGGDLISRIFSTAARVFNVHPSHLSADSNRKNTESWSSLAQVDLILSIEKEFKFRMSTRDVMSLQSLQDVIDVVRRDAL